MKLARDLNAFACMNARMEAPAFDPPLDSGIEALVRLLVSKGIETFESCEGGSGHAYPEPTVRFHGGPAEGYKALSYALEAGYKVSALRRAWSVLDGEATGPHWEITLWEKLTSQQR